MAIDIEYNAKTGEWEEQPDRTSFGFHRENLFSKMREEEERIAKMNPEQLQNWLDNEKHYQERLKLHFKY
jgi:hypothetical protein